MDKWYDSESRVPTAIRYPSGTECDTVTDHFSKDKRWEIAEGVYADFKNDSVPDNIIITYGRLCKEAISASQNANAGIIVLERLSGLGSLAKALAPILDNKNVIIAEEGVYSGSVAMNLEAHLKAERDSIKISTLAIKDSFVAKITEENIYKTAGIDRDAIRSRFI